MNATMDKISQLDANNDSTSESNINKNTADAEFTAEENQAAHFEQLQPTPKNVKTLSDTKLKNAMDQFLGNYRLCGEEVRKSVNAIMLLLSEHCTKNFCKDS